MKAIDWTKWSAFAEILSAIAIVVTLLYLADQTRELRVQTEQNNAALEAQTRMSHANRRSDYFNRLSTDPALMQIMARARMGEPLDAIEEDRLMAHYVAMFIGWQWEWEEHERGRLDIPEAAWRSAFSTKSGGLGNSPEARKAWEQNRELFQPGFVAFIDSVVLE